MYNSKTTVEDFNRTLATLDDSMQIKGTWRYVNNVVDFEIVLTDGNVVKVERTVSEAVK